MRQLLEQLVGRTVVEVSQTDAAEIKEDGQSLDVFLFLDNGGVFKLGPNSFRFFKPGEYQG